ncbi:EAL domain-containing protein [Acidithiobacillus thiooxidans]|uniref:EAL domain-containing protein n=1 Tax=Acidithiobacillus thiooxidans TaxID=930 RepID=UPI002860F386|nr:EAL domain-containing protein [Acidithiobacillus thiooxidans]MDR7927819.1 EAL domain-containing protein [Acidithiobacillus thiooxidans]
MVEDDAPSRQLLVRRLSHAGWQVLDAPDGPSALEIVATHALSGILLDMGLPGMNGLEVLQRIRQNSTPLILPIIMVTAFDERDYLAEALSKGANDFVSKPVDFSALKARLKAHLALAETSKSLSSLQARQELILRGANDGIWELDVQSGRLNHSQRWLALLQCQSNQADMTIEQWIARVHPEDQDRIAMFIQDYLGGHQSETLSLEYRIRREDGHYLWIHTRGAAEPDSSGQYAYVAGTHTNISKDRYKHQVTGLNNIACLSDFLVSMGSFQPEKSLGILLIIFNYDSQSPKERDIYRHIAESLAKELYLKIPQVLQVGTGKETNHLIIITEPMQTGNLNLTEMINTTIPIINNIILQSSDAGNISYHCGLLEMKHDITNNGEPFTNVLAAAEHAAEMNLPVYAFDASLREKSERKKLITKSILEAIVKKNICPYLQPILLNGREIAGFESLARWHHEDLGMISPAEFLPIARTSGQMLLMTQSLLDQSLEALNLLRKKRLVGDQIYVSVNFEAEQLLHSEFEYMLENETQRHGLHPHHLCIELVESSWLDVSKSLRECLNRLRARGYMLALDDFGTGYSSLSMLNQLPFSTLKIDQSFVRNMLSNHSTQSLVEAIIAIAKALKLRIIAEGVETLEEERFLLEAGVELTQGFLRARPMAMEALQEWLGEHSQQ